MKRLAAKQVLSRVSTVWSHSFSIQAHVMTVAPGEIGPPWVYPAAVAASCHPAFARSRVLKSELHHIKHNAEWEPNIPSVAHRSFPPLALLRITEPWYAHTALAALSLNSGNMISHGHAYRLAWHIWEAAGHILDAVVDWSHI